jgi:hypothetical protein
VNGSGTGRYKQRLILLTSAFLVCLAAIWYFASGRAEPPAPAPAAQEEAEPEPAAAPVAAAPPAEPRRPPPPAPAPAADPDAVTTSDGLPIMPVRGEASGPVHPHPITPKHLRIYAENRLIAALDGAMDVQDVAGMRRLLEQYRREYPEDDNQLQDGYALIADCLDHPGAPARAAAEQWLDSHNGSGLKRFVTKHCLEPTQP